MPAAFRSALRPVGELTWDWHADRLRGALLNESVSIEAHHGQVVIDLVNWKDPWAFHAPMAVTRDEVVVDCAGEALGRLLALFRSCDFDAGLQDADSTVRSHTPGRCGDG